MDGGRLHGGPEGSGGGGPQISGLNVPSDFEHCGPRHQLLPRLQIGSPAKLIRRSFTTWTFVLDPPLVQAMLRTRASCYKGKLCSGTHTGIQDIQAVVHTRAKETNVWSRRAAAVNVGQQDFRIASPSRWGLHDEKQLNGPVQSIFLCIIRGRARAEAGLYFVLVHSESRLSIHVYGMWTNHRMERGSRPSNLLIKVGTEKDQMLPLSAASKKLYQSPIHHESPSAVNEYSHEIPVPKPHIPKKLLVHCTHSWDLAGLKSIDMDFDGMLGNDIQGRFGRRSDHASEATIEQRLQVFYQSMRIRLQTGGASVIQTLEYVIGYDSSRYPDHEMIPLPVPHFIVT
ncbi:hypothetical protein ACLOJK_011564 [Asimina triloba]